MTRLPHRQAQSRCVPGRSLRGRAARCPPAPRQPPASPPPQGAHTHSLRSSPPGCTSWAACPCTRRSWIAALEREREQLGHHRPRSRSARLRLRTRGRGRGRGRGCGCGQQDTVSAAGGGGAGPSHLAGQACPAPLAPASVQPDALARLPDERTRVALRNAETSPRGARSLCPSSGDRRGRVSNAEQEPEARLRV